MKKSLFSTIALVLSATIFSSVSHADTVVVLGASGKIGSAIVQEALNQGHKVIGVSRSPDKLTVDHKKFKAVKGDPTDAESMKEIASKADAIIVAVGGMGPTEPANTAMNKTAQALTKAFSDKGAKSPQVVIIGGATTMYKTEENMIANLPERLAAMVVEGSPMYGMFVGHLVTYETYMASNINFTFIAPAMDIQGWSSHGAPKVADQRTGSYRTSTTTALTGNGGPSTIFMSDLAFAAVDMIDQPEFNHKRVNVAN